MNHRRVTLASLLLAGVACTSADKPAAAKDAEGIRVLGKAPDPRGRYLCQVDSISTAVHGVLQIDCEVGGDTTYTVRNDTVVFITRYEKAPDADSKLGLLDYWKQHLAPEFEKRFGGRASNIAQSTRGLDFEYFEATWDRPNGIRELITVSRRVESGQPPTRRVVKRETLDCRTKGPIGCR